MDIVSHGCRISEIIGMLSRLQNFEDRFFGRPFVIRVASNSPSFISILRAASPDAILNDPVIQ